MLKLPIKASQIANLTDARYFAAWHVDWLGFSLDNSAPNHLQPAEFVAMREWVEGPKIVGEFGLKNPQEILQLAELMQLEAVQVGPFIHGAALEPLKDLEVFKEVVVDLDRGAESVLEELKESATYVKYFLLDFSKSGWDWEQVKTAAAWGEEALQNICHQFPVLLDLPIPVSEIEMVLTSLKVKGLNLRGGEEEKVGVKSYDELDEILEVLEIQE